MKNATSAINLNKHQIKTEATLRGLLDASERVFVRDGYERAQIETIAAEAGRTKGAVYAHFRSKEDIFFALIERKAGDRRDEFLRSSEGMNLEQRLTVVKKLFLGALENENWPILMLEFKLLALRNKVSLQRVRDLYQLIYEDMSRAVLPGMGISTEKTKERDAVALAVLRGIPSALILEKQFNPVLISSAVAKQVFESIFDALLGIGNNRSVLQTSIKTKKAKRSSMPYKQPDSN
jgi:AcrR family transcriptional regulator